MDIAPIYLLVGSGVIGIALATWIVWRAVRRLADPAVSVWEKALAMSLFVTGTVLVLLDTPLFGLPVIGSALGALATRGGSAAGGVGGGSGGSGCGGGGSC